METWLNVADSAVVTPTDVQQPRSVGCYAKKDGKLVSQTADAMLCLGDALLVVDADSCVLFASCQSSLCEVVRAIPG